LLFYTRIFFRKAIVLAQVLQRNYGKVFNQNVAIIFEKIMVNLDSALIGLIVNIVVSIVVLAPSLWISGRILVGGQKAKVTDAIWIVVLGSVISSIFGFFFEGIIASLIMLVIILALVKHFFDCGWLKALAISIIAAVIFIAIAFVLALIGVGIGFTLFGI
jgi:hypothetical protein